VSAITSPSPRQRAAAVLVFVGLLLALVGYLAFGSSPEGSTPIAIELAQSSSEDGTEPVSGEVDAPLAIPMVTYDVYLDRDPFEPVLKEAEEGTGEGDPSADAPSEPAPAPAGRIVVDPATGQLIVVQDTTPTTGGDTDPTLTPGDSNVTPSPDHTGGTCQGEDEVVCDGRVVTLHEVRSNAQGDVAVFQVDTVTHEVGVGSVFAESFRVLSIEGQCATFLYGDDTSTLCAGQRTLK
jgi:hypothetical protein